MIKYNNNLHNIRAQQLPKDCSKMDLPAELEKIINKLKIRVEREIPDRGYFRNFAENLETGKEADFFGSNIALFIERDEEREGRAFLGVAVLHPQISMDASAYLINGDRNTLLKYLQDPNLQEKLQEKIFKLSESLKNAR